MNNEITKLMKALDISEQEAKELIAFDKEVEQDKSYTDKNLTPEQRAVEKKMRQTTAKKPTVYKWDNRGKCRKADDTKLSIIAKLAEFIKANFDENAVIENEQRLIQFEFEEKKFDLTLIKKRSK